MVRRSTCELNIAIDLSFKKVRSSGGKLISYKMCELATFCEQVTVCVKTSRQRHSRSESSRAVWTFSQNLSVLVVSPIPKKKIIFFSQKMTGETPAPSLIAKVLIFSICFGTLPYVEETNPSQNNKGTDFPRPVIILGCHGDAFIKKLSEQLQLGNFKL